VNKIDYNIYYFDMYFIVMIFKHYILQESVDTQFRVL